MSRFYRLVVMEWLMWCQWILTSQFWILFLVGAHMSWCVNADSPTHSCRHSELCFGCLFNEDQCQSINYCGCSITHTKNNINSIHFNNNIKSNYNVKWYGHNSWPFPISSDTPIRGMGPFIGGDPSQRIVWVHSCNWSTHVCCSPGTPVLPVASLYQISHGSGLFIIGRGHDRNVSIFMSTVAILSLFGNGPEFVFTLL